MLVQVEAVPAGGTVPLSTQATSASRAAQTQGRIGLSSVLP